MANRRAIVSGPTAYQEIGSAGIAADSLSVGATGIVGTAGSMSIYGDELGSGSDKSIIIGEQGASALTNIVHFFGSTSSVTVGTVKIHGNLEVDGTENVVGDATFEANATFEGNTTFGDAATDTVVFVAGVASDIQFDASAGNDRTIDIEASAGAGTNLVLGAGPAGGAGPSDGGNVTIFPAGPAGAGNYGEVLIGNAARVDPNDAKVGPAMLLNTGNANPAGFRWNSSDTKLQYRIDNTTAWVDLVGGGGTLPVGTQIQEHLYWTGATWAPDGGNLTMPNGGSAWTISPVTDAAGAPATQGLVVRGASGSTAGSRGGGLALIGGPASGASAAGGHAYVQGGTRTGAGTWGNVLIGRAIDGTYDGAVYIGSGSDGNSPVIKVDIAADTIDISGDVKFSEGGNSATVDFAPGDGSLIVSDIPFDGSVAREINMTIIAAKGNALTLRGQTSTGSDGGPVGIVAGGGTASGGTIGLDAGPASAGPGGNVEINAGPGSTVNGSILIGENTTAEIVFGDGGALTNALYANTATSATKAGIRYNSTSPAWQIRADNVTPHDWANILYSGGPGSVPDGTVTGQRLEWNQLTPAWEVNDDIALPAGQVGTRTISLQDHTAATAAEALIVSGQENTSVGPGTTTGGVFTVKGGNSLADVGGDLVIGGGIGGSGNGEILFGDGVNGHNIDFQPASGNRINSDITFADKGVAGSWSIKPATAFSTVGTGLSIAAAEGASTGTGGLQGGGMSVAGGLGGISTGTGNGGDGGNFLLNGLLGAAGAGGAGGTGGAGGGGSNIQINGGPAGAVGGGGTGGTGGSVSATSGPATGDIAGAAMSFTAGLSVGSSIGGTMNVTAGANTGTANGGPTNITGGASTASVGGPVIIRGGAGVTNGSISLGDSNTGTVTLGGTNNWSIGVGDAIPVLGFNGTATINLPGTGVGNNFRIQGVAVSDNVDAPNLATLTAGPASDASALHTHSGIGSVSAVAGEIIAINSVVAFAPDGTNQPRAYACNTTSSPGGASDGPLPAGFSESTTTLGGTFDIKTTGDVTLVAALWAGGTNPAVTDVGKPVYAFTNLVGGGGQGFVSLTPPASGSGDWRTKVGLLKSVVAATSGTIAIQIGDSVLMS